MDGMGWMGVSYTTVTPRASLQSDADNSTTIEEIAKKAKHPKRPNNTYCLQYDHQGQHFIQLLHRCTTLPTPLVTSSPTLSIFLSSCCSTYCLECSIGMVLACSASIELVSPSARVTSAKSQQGVVVSDSVREDGTHRLDPRDTCVR